MPVAMNSLRSGILSGNSPERAAARVRSVQCLQEFSAVSKRAMRTGTGNSREFFIRARPNRFPASLPPAADMAHRHNPHARNRAVTGRAIARRAAGSSQISQCQRALRSGTHGSESAPTLRQGVRERFGNMCRRFGAVSDDDRTQKP